MLDELLVSGEVIWSGVGAISSNDGWVAFHLADTAPLTLSSPAELDLTEVHRAVLDVPGILAILAAGSSSANCAPAARSQPSNRLCGN